MCRHLCGTRGLHRPLGYRAPWRGGRGVAPGHPLHGARIVACLGLPDTPTWPVDPARDVLSARGGPRLIVPDPLFPRITTERVSELEMRHCGQ